MIQVLGDIFVLNLSTSYTSETNSLRAWRLKPWTWTCPVQCRTQRFFLKHWAFQLCTTVTRRDALNDHFNNRKIAPVNQERPNTTMRLLFSSAENVSVRACLWSHSNAQNALDPPPRVRAFYPPLTHRGPCVASGREEKRVSLSLARHLAV